jgi:hypothetical protein
MVSLFCEHSGQISDPAFPIWCRCLARGSVAAASAHSQLQAIAMISLSQS